MMARFNFPGEGDEVARPLGRKMEVATKSNGPSVEVRLMDKVTNNSAEKVAASRWHLRRLAYRSCRSRTSRKLVAIGNEKP